MLAALLLNLTSGQAPSPPVGQTFGGGPFWRKYGYDSAYDDIRDQTTSAALPSTDDQESDAVVRRPDIKLPPRTDYRLVRSRVSEEVARDMGRLRKEFEEQKEDELLMIFSLLE